MGWIAVNPIKSALSIALLLALIWGWRVDVLRAGYKRQLSDVTMVIADVTGAKVKYADAPNAIMGIAIERDRAKGERDDARRVVKVQSDSINAYAAETDRLAKLSEESRAIAQAAIRERNTWIERAKSAETRTERRSCEQEVEEINAVLDGLFRDGF